jgi:hypothetical protein
MITPLACTIVDWQTFLAIHAKLGIPAPTRQLDAVGMSVQSPASFLASIGGGGPIVNLRTAYTRKSTDLIHMVFAIESDEKLLANLQETRLTCINYGEVTLLCGTLTTIMDAIIACSHRHSPLLQLMNALFVYLDRGGFRECFYDYTRESIPPSSFILKHR